MAAAVPAAAAAAAPVAAAPALVPPVVPFALAPSLIDNNPIDYSNAAGVKQYKTNSDCFSHKFDGEPKNLRLFLEQVSERARTANWTGIVTVLDDNAVARNLVTEYGMVSLANVRAHALLYIGQPLRNAQNSFQLYTCLSQSLTEDAKLKAIVNREQYTVNGTPDGPLFLKTIIMSAHVDTRATSAHIRLNLSSLDNYMSHVTSDIEKFNQYVKLQVSELAARGEQSNNLLVNLFKGYAAASDATFIEYILKKKDAYEEGADLDPSALMLLAENKFKTLKQECRWNSLSKEEEKIVALTAQFESLKSKNDSHAKKAAKSKDKKGKGKHGKGGSPGRKNIAPWQTEPPASGESHKKHHDGKDYFWCVHHRGWFTSHGTKNCRKGKKEGESSGNPAAKKLESSNLQLSKALSTIIEEEGTFHDE